MYPLSQTQANTPSVFMHDVWSTFPQGFPEAHSFTSVKDKYFHILLEEREEDILIQNFVMSCLYFLLDYSE